MSHCQFPGCGSVPNPHQAPYNVVNHDFEPLTTDATNDVVTEARAHIARLKADMRGVDTGCTNSYDTSLLGSLCAEIERLTKALTLLAHNVECFKKTPIEDFMPSLEAVLVVANLPPHKCEVCNA